MSFVDVRRWGHQITEMCKSCNWDCYLKRYPGLKNKQWEAEHPQKGLEYAKLHYVKYGRAAGRSCFPYFPFMSAVSILGRCLGIACSCIHLPRATASFVDAAFASDL